MHLIGTEWKGFHLLATACYCMALFLGGLSVNILGPGGPTLAREMSSSLTMIGSIFSAEGVGNLMGSSLVAAMLERHGVNSVVLCVCMVLFVAVGLVPSCTMLVQVIALYVCVGICLGLLNGMTNTAITWLHHGRNVGPWINILNACFGAGASCAPLLFVAVERHIGNGLAAWSAISAFAALPALLAWLLESPRQPPKAPPSAEESPEESTGRGDLRTRTTIAGVDVGSRAAFVHLTVLGPMLVTVTLIIGAEFAYAAWVYAYAMERVGMRSTDAACLNSLYWTSFTASRVFVMAPLSTYFSPASMLVPNLALNAFAILLIGAFPDDITVLWCATVLAGIGVAVLYANTFSLVSSYDLLTPRSASLLSMSSALGHMVLPNVVGIVIDRSGSYDALIWMASACNVTGLLITVAVVRHLRANFTVVHGIGAKPRRGGSVELSDLATHA